MAGSFTHTLNSLFAAQLDARSAEIADVFFKGNPLFEWVNTIRKAQIGSERFWLPVEFTDNSTVAMIGKGGTVDLSDSDPITTARYVKLTMAGNVTSFRQEAQENKGKGQVFELIQAKIDNLIATMKAEFETQFTANSLTAGNLNPLSTLVESTAEASQTTTVGGIDRTSNTYWRNSSKNMTDRATSTFIVDDFQDAWAEVFKEGQGNADIIILDLQTFLDYENYSLDQKQFVNTMIGDFSFTTLLYKGIPLIPITHENFTTAGDRRAYFLSSSTIKLAYDPSMWFTWTDWKEPDNQPFDKVKQVVATSNLCTSNPRRNHVLFNIGETT